MSVPKPEDHDGTMITSSEPGNQPRGSECHIAKLFPRIISALCRFGLAGVFLWSGFAKVSEPAAFLASIEGFRILPYHWAWLTSLLLPWLEITTALALLAGRSWTRAGALLAALMLLGFMVAVGSAWIRGLEINCGCFGQSDDPTSYPWILSRNFLLLTAGLLVFAGTEFSPKEKQNEMQNP
ncbi:hypothetical protein OPIT5_00105 (plasmid) [Opitutaceae bacterium TAV5]|nr:hypothetical protein OPIT5_00105 [Opitutaceae bacterium TAV5]